MTKVFLGGSRNVSRVNSSVRQRLDNVIERGHAVVVGDANGADKAMQAYLSDRGYRNVEVFCSGRVCRNNVGEWRVRHVAVRPAMRGAEFYSAKDQAMASEAEIGLMLWDGKSVGTLANVFRLIFSGKKAVIYNVADKQFYNIQDQQGWDDFASGLGSGLRTKLAERVSHAPESTETARSGLF